MDDLPELYKLESVEQLRTAADPLRLRIIEALSQQAMTATQLGEALGLPANKVHYHVRELERVGLVKLAETREKGGILEKYYRLVAHSLEVPKTLLRSVPPDESIAAMSEVLQSIVDNFMRDVSRVAHEQAWTEEPIALCNSEAWLTADEFRLVTKQLQAILKPYEERRNIAGEQQRTFVLMGHTTRLFSQQEQEDAMPLTLRDDASAADREGGKSPTAQSTLQRVVVVGVLSYGRQELERLIARGRRLDITLLGYLSVAADVSAELADRAIARFRHRGVLNASPEVRAVLKRKSDQTA